MTMFDLHLSVPSEVVEEVDALAERLGESRSNLMLRVLQLGVDQLRTRKAGPPTRRAGSRSRVGRSAGRRKKIWRCPGDWEIFDKLVALAKGFLETQPNMEREALRVKLATAVADLHAEDPTEVVERALNRMLGRPYGPATEFPRPVPGNPLPPD